MLGTIERAPGVRPERSGERGSDSELDLKARVGGILGRWPCVGLAAGVIRDGGLESFHGHGVADIASRLPITEDTVFRVASISKTFTGVAVMQLYEQGLVDLDAPVNDYLRAYRLIPRRPGSRPATVRHLLTHTGGIPELVHPSGVLRPDFGESVMAGEPMPTLAQFYRGGIRLVAEPGTRFSYGNHGFATLGQLVEDVSGTPLHRYLRERIFEPLGMTDSDLLRTERVKARLATGYELRSGGFRAVGEREMVTAGAASVYSTSRDMARYLAALLGGGTNEHGTVLAPATVASMFEPHYQPHPLIPGMGLSFFRIDLGGHRAVEHQGTLPGSHSQVFLAPDDGVAVMAFTNGSWRPDFWLPAESSGLLRDLLGIPGDAVRTDIPQRPEVWDDIRGWYQLECPLTDVRMRAMLGAGAEIFVRDGRLMLRALTPIPVLYQGFPLSPDDETDPYVFRMDLSAFGLGAMRVVFGHEPGAGVTSVHLDVMPLSLRKRSGATNPRRWATGALGALGAATAAAVLRRGLRWT